MATFSGVVSTLGITPSLLSAIGSTAVNAGLNQVFQGSAGRSFLGQTGQVVVGNLSTNVINVALNSALGSKINGVSGLSLTNGSNFLASTITPLVTSTLAAEVNKTIDRTLQAAGPFAPLLSQITTGLVSQGVAGLNNLFGNGGGGAAPGSSGSKTFPGAGNEPDAEYSGGGAYTLGTNGRDVVFSIRPANEGPQSEGTEFSQSGAFAPTTLSMNEIANIGYSGIGENSAVDVVKREDMQNGPITTRAPQPFTYTPPPRGRYG
jgi:hypothetical protein